ncbi:MAG: acyltransferase family protein [Stellaceae bacterium]
MAALKAAVDERSRANNFSLLRLLAALTVVYGHSFEIARPASGQADLVWLALRETWSGELGVWVFFAISGFLIAKSWTERNDIVAFAGARLLRLLPALLVMLCLVTFVLAPIFTSLSSPDYFAHRGIYGFVLWNGSLLRTVYVLPGVFDANPQADVVNKSLWTLPIEARLYVLVALAGLVGLLRRRALFNLVALALGGVILAEPQWFGLKDMAGASALAVVFILGAAAFINRDRIPLSGMLLVAGLGLTALLAGTALYRPALVGAVAYATLWLAYAVPAFNVERWGDFSYGIYIYAYPLQQAVVAIWPETTPLALFGVAGALSLCCAVASWHLIEAPCLALKSRRVVRSLAQDAIPATTIGPVLHEP